MDEKEKDMVTNEGNIDEGAHGERLVYEIGFQIIPTITDEEADSVFSEVKSLLEKKDAELISEGAPELRDLSYEMSKKIAGKYQKFTKGYFGWVKFVLSRGEIVSFQREVEMMEKVLRFLIIKTVRENTLISQKFQGGKRTEDSQTENSSVEGAVPVSPEAMDEEIDKTLENLEIK